MQSTPTGQSTQTVKAGPIKHLVILCMENRSFDHYFGALALEKPERGIRGLEPGKFVISDRNGVPQRSWRMDEALDPVQAHDVADIPHGFLNAHSDWNNGANDGFLKQYQAQPGGRQATYPMGYYTRETLSVLYALADEFTICDNWFASLLSSTWPNRKYLHSGRRDGDNDTQICPMGRFQTTPIYDLIANSIDPLSSDKIDWRSYFCDTPFLAFWDEFAVRNISKFAPIDIFVRDCADQTLPAISIIDPPFSLASDHPPQDPRVGQKFISLVVDALTNSRSWHDSALVIVYDEFGGFYDHVPPKPAPEPSPIDTMLGFRVPAVVVSPYAKRCCVSQAQYDHTSIMRSIGERWGIDWRTENNAYGTRWEYVNGIWDDIFDFEMTPRPTGVYTGPEVQVEWQQGIRERLSHPLGDFELALQHLFVLPELAQLDKRHTMHETLGQFEDKVKRLKTGSK